LVVVTLACPSHWLIVRGYDALNRMKTVQEANTGTTSYTYDNVGNLQSVTYPNGVVHNYTYDNRNRLTNLGVNKSAAAIGSYAYTLDAAGHRLSVSELSGRSVNYGYDSIYRLTSETIAGDPNNVNGAASYVYDAVGNRTQKTSTIPGFPGGLTNYNANDQLSTDTYDNDGNTTASSGLGYVYDFENHVIQAGGGITMVYDGDGNRVQKTVAGVTAKYLVDPQSPTGYAQVVYETFNGSTSASREISRIFVYGLERISQFRSYFINGVSHTQTSYYVYDGHGSTRALTDPSGNVTDTYDYDAFGNLLHSTATGIPPGGTTVAATPNEFLFAGEQFDSDLNLYYSRARYLNVSTGRFWGMDTYEGDAESPLSLHKYLYASANPADRVDPTGYEDLASLTVALGIGATIGGYATGYVYTGTLKGAVTGGIAGGLLGIAIISKNPKLITQVIVNGLANAIATDVSWELFGDRPPSPADKEQLVKVFASGELNAFLGTFWSRVTPGNIAVGLTALSNSLVYSICTGECWKQAVIPALVSFIAGTLAGVGTSGLKSALAGNGPGAEALADTVAKAVSTYLSIGMKPVVKSTIKELFPDVDRWLNCE
jgi:RHS repeat-associated protein